MKTVSISAHFDGERIRLDEPIELEPNTRLIVTILPKDDAERDTWLRLSARRLVGAYGEDEEDNSLETIREANIDYARSVK